MDTKWLDAVAPNLDKFLMYKILTFADKRGAVNVKSAIRQIVDRTCMYDIAIEIAPEAEKAAVTSRVEEKKKRFEKIYEDTRARCGPLFDKFFMESESEAEAAVKLRFTTSQMDELRKNSELSLEALKATGFDKKMIDAIYELGFRFYEMGWSQEAATMLRFYADVMRSESDGARELSVMWGLLATDQLAENWINAVRDIEAIRTRFEESPQERTVTAQVWLLHWSLFTYFKAPKRVALLVDHVVSFPWNYLNVVECAAPHLMKHLAAACILTRRRVALRRLARIIDQGTAGYSDEFTQFIDVLINHSKFNTATGLIEKLKTVAAGDYFLCEHVDDLANNAKKLVFEDYIRVHKTVSIDYVAKSIGKSTTDTEMWLADLVREAKIDAKIDSVAAMVTVTTAKSSVYQRVLEKLESIDRPAA